MSSEGAAVAALTLDDWRTKVEACAEQVKTLKTTDGVEKEAVSAAVTALLDAKRSFAKLNKGIGIDGKPFEEPMSKADKKKQKKQGTPAGPAKETADPNSEGAKKKAAKKAEAKAKKAALQAAKQQGGANAPPALVEESAAPKAAPTVKAPISVPVAVKKAASNRPLRTKSLAPLALAWNPNSSLADRPVMALATAVFTNTILDLTLVSDHTRPLVGLGLEEGAELTGDAAMARYLARRASTLHPHLLPVTTSLLGESFSEQALVDQWVDYALTVSKFRLAKKVVAIANTLHQALSDRTYLVGSSMTLADLALFGALGFPSQAADLSHVLAPVDVSSPMARWCRLMAASPVIQQATQLAVGIANNQEAIFDATAQPLDALEGGMNPLQGGTPGGVVTRFPPEPSGYLHIGHAKAVLLNDYYARRYKGRLIVRFDDTNPSKEKEEYQSSILEDLGKLGVKPDVVTFTSDYFGTIRHYAQFLIQNGLAYMDDTPQEQMQKERMERVNSKYRDTQTPEEAMALFHKMCAGDKDASTFCLRAKIDMQSVNGTMRDPVLYRQNTVNAHHRTGTTFKAYPTYDLACPIVDSLEGVTHALRTTEYNDRDEQYQWIQATLGLRRVRIHSFSRMNFMYTELSKRKLAWFVDHGHVTGWDDARFPTVRGVVRRGINITALRNFMYAQGASRRIVNMEWGKFWAENKKEIDKLAKRFMAIDKTCNVVLHVTNGPSGNSLVTTPYHPKNPDMGQRVVRISNKVLLETIDVEGMMEGEEIVLMRWGVVKVTKITTQEMWGTFVPDGNVKAAKRKLSWMAVGDNKATTTPCTLMEFDNLITKEKLEEGDNFQDHINPNTMASTEAIGDAGLKTLQHHEVIQLERRGYYRVDRPYMSEDKPLILFMVPDGKTKSMGGLTGKLAHR